MNKTMLIAINEGLVQIITGIQAVQSIITLAVEEETDVNVETVKEVGKAVEGFVEIITTSGRFVKADLDEMSYADIKKLAKECGISAKGSKDAIIEKILAVDVEVEAPTVEEIAEEEVSTQESDSEEETEEEDTEVDEEEDIQTMVERETAEMSLEEIAEVLSDVGKSTKGKRQALIARLVEAVEEGLISFDEEEEVESTTVETDEEEEDVVEESDDEEEEESLESELEEIYAEMGRDEAKSLVKALGDKVLKKDTVESLIEKVRQHDSDTILEKLQELGILDAVEEESEEEYFNKDTMTVTRKEAIAKAKKEVLADIKSGSISIKDIDKTLADFYLPHEGYEKSLPKQEKIDMFVEAFLRLLDDEGEENEFESPYYIDEKPVCCGHFLKDVDDTLYCEVCGTEYDNE